jgi:hypothetical protein
MSNPKRRRRVLAQPLSQPECDTSSTTSTRPEGDGERTEARTEERDRHGRFQPGNQAAVGRRPRAFTKAAVRKAVSEKDVEQIMRRLAKAAKNGSITAAQIVLDRTLGRARIERDTDAVELGFRAPSTIAECAEAQARVIEAVAGGQLPIHDAERVTHMIEVLADRLAEVELGDRVRALEALAGPDPGVLVDHEEKDS